MILINISTIIIVLFSHYNIHQFTIIDILLGKAIEVYKRQKGRLFLAALLTFIYYSPIGDRAFRSK